ncbi:MAG: zinc-ribbon domain-containing protein [Deltaproteobacteria bacterium]|nr:zinc-ribbon domain-containing protein [Deltaproteobacteria bacterium]
MSMVNVDCPGCGSAYNVSEKRIPKSGLKMRCPKCGESFLIEKPEDGGDAAAGAPPKAPKRPRARTAVGVGVPGVKAGMGLRHDAVGAPTPPPTKRPIFSPPRPTPAVGEDVSVGAEGLLAQDQAQVTAPDTADVDAGFGDLEPAADDGGGFGVIDLSLPEPDGPAAPAGPAADAEGDLPMAAVEQDLPMPVGAGAGLPTPPPRRAPPPRPPKAPPRPPQAPPPAPLSSDADLPMPAVTDADLPMPAMPDADLPMPAMPDADLPMPAVPDADLPMAAGGADLPMAAGGADLPMPVATEADLPMAAGGADLPMAAGQADLPMAAGQADLPMAAGQADLPMAAGGADLPMPAAGLPVPADQDLPLPAAGLPVPADQNLPLPAAGLPVPADQDLPLPAAGLPVPADQDLPLPSPTGDLPQPADMDFPVQIGASEADIPLEGDDPMPLPGEASPFTHDAGADAGLYDGASQQQLDQAFLDGGQFPSDAPPPGAGGEFHAETVSEPPRGGPPKAAGVGDEFDLDQVAGETELEPTAGMLEDEDGEPRVKLKRKRSRSLRITLVLVPLIAVGGILLNFTPVGPFGYHAISDALNASKYDSALTSFRSSAQAQLESDTAAEAQAAFARARGEQAQMPRFAPMGAYAAYLAFMKSIRFGRDSATETAAKQMLSRISEAAHGDLWDLAKAALAATEGNVKAAQAAIARLSQRIPNDIDVLVLAAEIELSAHSPKTALPLWVKAVSVKKSARTLYGQARTQMALGKPKEARTSADQVLKLSKNHAGARTLVATLLWQENPKSPKGAELLGEVIAKGPVRDAASKSELVTAFSVLGSIHLSQSHLGAAEEAFEEALKLDPQSERTLIGKGEVFYAAGRYTEALGGFEAARRAGQKNVLAVVGVAKSKIALERAKEARGELIGLLKTSKHPLVGYWLGQAQEALGDRKSAEEAYRAAIKVGRENPEVVRAYVALADLLGSRGDAQGAADTLAEATEKLPKSAALHNARGDVALKAGRLGQAKKEFLEALKIEDDNLNSRFRLAITQRRAREFDAAAKEYDAIAKVDPNFPGLALEQGLLFHETGQTDKALEMYNAALKKAPNDDDLKLRVGSTQVISGQPKEALPLLQEVFNKRPQSAEVNHFLGRAKLMIGESPQEALTYLEAAVRHDANRAEYHLYVGWAANEAGQPTLAEKAIEKALALDRNLGDAYWQRAVVLLKRQQTLDALDDLAIALEKNPTRYEAYATMAMCHQEQTNYPAAEEAWQKAIEGDDSVPEWHYRLGEILVNRNANTLAGPHLLKAVELSTKRKQTPGWLWKANYLLGEALRTTDKERALAAFKEFKRLTTSENAYRPDAERAISELEGKR